MSVLAAFYQYSTLLYLCILIGTDIKKEAPVISSRIRQRFLNYEKPYQIFRIGSNNKTVFKTIDLGIDSKSLSKLKDKKFTDVLKKSSKPIFILGQGAMKMQNLYLIILWWFIKNM